MPENEFDRTYNYGVIQGLDLADQILSDFLDTYHDSHDALLALYDAKLSIQSLKERQG